MADYHKKTTLWASWVNKTVLVRNNFWNLSIPKDCSWIWRKVLQLRVEARNYISYKIENGDSILLWFDPWWNKKSLASSLLDPAIAAVDSTHRATLHSLIYAGNWNIPNLNRSFCNDNIKDLLENFDFPNIDLSEIDIICWDGIKRNKVNTRVIRDSIRTRKDEVPWYEAVWVNKGTNRYIYHNWLLCHGRMNTLDRLCRLEITTDSHCYLCAGGLETSNHLFNSCSYSHYILLKMLSVNMNIPIDSSLTWLEIMATLQNISDKFKRQASLIATQTFVYHIWKERNNRRHNGTTSPPSKVLHDIIFDLRARLQATRWFSEIIVNRPDIQLWISGFV